MKRARVLDRADLIPEKWKAMSSEELELSVQDLRSRISAVTASGDSKLAEFADISPKVREKLAKSGQALSDGSYAIRNVSDLTNAIQASGHVAEEDRDLVRNHIGKQAKALGKEDLIPQDWKEASSLGKASAAEFVEQVGIYTAKTQPRDTQGKFRKVLARLKQDLGDSGLADVQEKVAATEKLNNVGDYMQAAKSATELIDVIGRLDSGALDSKALANVRTTAGLLGEVIANLPLPFGKDAEKIRFSDLPPALKDLVEDMITRVEDKIGKEDGDVATEKLRKYMAGGDYFNQGEVSSEMSKLLRLLT
jgi:hypothetical protein